MLKTNEIYCGNCADLLNEIDDNTIDLTLTSPPYDSLRSYNGYVFNFDIFKKIASELFRITKKGGSVVWVVGDETIQGSETGTSLKQALYFKEIGFNLHDTMIYEKNSSTFPAKKDGNRYTQIFEYMFVFSKGKPKCKLICDKINKWAGHSSFDRTIPPVPEKSPRTNIWKYTTSFNDNKFNHPASFPIGLAKDHILTWTEKEDLVIDPMCGSGITVRVADMLERKYIGIDISEDYCKKVKESLKIGFSSKSKKNNLHKTEIFDIWRD